MTMNTTNETLPRLGVGAVIRNERNEILLVWRNRNPQKDTWSIPGGKIDPYEQLEACVIREIKEEVDLDVEIVGLLCMAETIQADAGEHWVSAIYEVVVKNGVARNMEEGGAIGAVKWFALDNLPANLACFTLPAIEALQKRAAAPSHI
ncbi:NUDIX domain-containing protein [Brevibacillus parabrevis]|uniref:NUDIX domain-containing protein n=1 Tax=Brevibacillus TaxID=55080 RepID=UPI000EC60267|nr:DNA mismatch repair protein MutT [Brevibacillus sp.]